MRKTTAAAVILGALCASPAAAKVVFTGYGDFQTTPEGDFRLDGPPSVLNRFGVGPANITTRSSTINALGLFATTSLNDQTRLMMDVTYKNIGATVNTLTVQYAFVEFSDFGATGRFGKITLPFGWYNQNRFYPFQHASITAPTFTSVVLGLPIADIGATVGRPFELGDVTLTADVYGVNGFASTPGSTTTFRDTGFLSSNLSIANNIGSGDNNHDVAFGARLDASHAALPNSSVGVSYYHDRWDPSGHSLFQMGNAYLHATAGGFDLLAEYLLLNAKNDPGALSNFGSPNWRTDGFFTELNYTKLEVAKHQVTPWVRYEDYLNHAVEGSGGKERLTDFAGGVAVALIDGVTAKFQGSDLYYRLPFQGQGDLKIQGYSFALAVTVTF
ncbi:MAG TPA: hypothetical protein VN915_13370 [Elusimicrobiota bacterium]|nr:hypothetical protein [Elusimicrobiota bacterium]